MKRGIDPYSLIETNINSTLIVIMMMIIIIIIIVMQLPPGPGQWRPSGIGIIKYYVVFMLCDGIFASLYICLYTTDGCTTIIMMIIVIMIITIIMMIIIIIIVLLINNN